MRGIRSSSGRSLRPAVASTPWRRPPARIGTASEPVDAERAHPVGIAGRDVRGGGLAHRGGRANGADQPVAQPGVASIGEGTPRLDQLAVRTGGRCRLEALLDVVHREDEGRAAEHRCRTDGDRLERRRPLERGAEVAAEPAEQLALPRLLALALLLDELLPGASRSPPRGR